MGINIFAHYLFIQRLLPVLEKTAKTAPPNSVRLVFQSSEMHRLAPGDDKFETLASGDEPDRDPARLYGRTKLAMILLGKEIVKRKLSPPNNVLVLSVHPGTVDTGKFSLLGSKIVTTDNSQISKKLGASHTA